MIPSQPSSPEKRQRYTADTPPVWADIERRALTCPVLHQAVTRVRAGDLTELEALIVVALWFADQRDDWFAEKVDRLMNELPSQAFRN